MNDIKVPFNKPFISGKELYYIADTVMKGHISGNGIYTKKCEDYLQDYTGCQKVLMTNSATAALEMACILIGIQPGDEVIMPSFTFVSTANAVVLRGGVPVFCDIALDDFNIDVEKLEECLSEKTKAIIPVHYAGQSCNMDEIMSFASKHNLYVIEDAAQSVGSYYKGKHSGSIGDLGCFSFHETKNIMCGEGGALLINNADFIEKAEVIREKGTNREAFFRDEVDLYTWVDQGSSYLPSELQMAFLYAQLENLTAVINKRKNAVDYYIDGLLGLEKNKKLSLPKSHKNSTTNYHLFPILCSTNKERDSLIKYLKSYNIITVFHYIPLHSSPAGEIYGRQGGVDTSVTDKVSSTLLRLPVYYDITVDEQDYVVRKIIDFYTKK